MTQTILAIFDTPDEVAATVQALQGEGIRRIEVLSSEPIHQTCLVEPAKSRIGWFAVLGALVGAGAAVWLTVGTSRRVHIVTGGMPMAPPWALGIIAFEVAMLGAIFASLIRMIFEARLARPKALEQYDKTVADDKVVLVVSCPDNNQVQVAESLLARTTAEIRKTDSAKP